MAGKTE